VSGLRVDGSVVDADGDGDTNNDGWPVGRDGLAVGWDDGLPVGRADGCPVGCDVVFADGSPVG
jgi:hypothetical protein